MKCEDTKNGEEEEEEEEAAEEEGVHSSGSCKVRSWKPEAKEEPRKAGARGRRQFAPEHRTSAAGAMERAATTTILFLLLLPRGEGRSCGSSPSQLDLKKGERVYISYWTDQIYAETPSALTTSTPLQDESLLQNDIEGVQVWQDEAHAEATSREGDDDASTRSPSGAPPSDAILIETQERENEAEPATTPRDEEEQQTTSGETHVAEEEEKSEAEPAATTPRDEDDEQTIGETYVEEKSEAEPETRDDEGEQQPSGETRVAEEDKRTSTTEDSLEIAFKDSAGVSGSKEEGEETTPTELSKSTDATVEQEDEVEGGTTESAKSATETAATSHAPTDANNFQERSGITTTLFPEEDSGGEIDGMPFERSGVVVETQTEDDGVASATSGERDIYGEVSTRSPAEPSYTYNYEDSSFSTSTGREDLKEDGSVKERNDFGDKYAATDLQSDTKEIPSTESHVLQDDNAVATYAESDIGIQSITTSPEEGDADSSATTVEDEDNLDLFVREDTRFASTETKTPSDKEDSVGTVTSVTFTDATERGDASEEITTRIPTAANKVASSRPETLDVAASINSYVKHAEQQELGSSEQVYSGDLLGGIYRIVQSLVNPVHASSTEHKIYQEVDYSNYEPTGQQAESSRRPLRRDGVITWNRSPAKEEFHVSGSTPHHTYSFGPPLNEEKGEDDGKIDLPIPHALARGPFYNSEQQERPRELAVLEGASSVSSHLLNRPEYVFSPLNQKQQLPSAQDQVPQYLPFDMTPNPPSLPAVEVKDEGTDNFDPVESLRRGDYHFHRFLNSQSYPLRSAFLGNARPRNVRHLELRNETNCEWIIKTEPGLYLLATFHNLSAPYTLDCHGAYIEVERESNGFEARWCGNRVTQVQGSNRPHVIFARSEIRITVYDDGQEHNDLPTGFSAEVEVVDLSDARQYDSFRRSHAYSNLRFLTG